MKNRIGLEALRHADGSPSDAVRPGTGSGPRVSIDLERSVSSVHERPASKHSYIANARQQLKPKTQGKSDEHQTAKNL